ncbi:MAG TPA: DUF1302 family protein [Candidatus Bathyarchaeia archaeon]|nr:DUF1302 family protein [Candidatus Bathyarchaeia archaeon]
MNGRVYVRQSLLGMALWLWAACCVTMLLTVPGLEAQEAPTKEEAAPAVKAEEPAAAAQDAAATAQDAAATAQDPALKPEEPTAKQEEPTAEPIQPKATKSLKLNWDTTLKYSNAFRLLPQSSTLVSPAVNSFNVNQDDGDRNFHGGLISNRGDLLSEIDLTYGSWGVRGSVEGWLDTTYNQRTGNNSPYTNNNITTNYLHFTNGTQEIFFRNAQLMDAFGFGKVSVGNGSLSFRGGQFAQFWGEALYFGNNGIAGAMAPIDVVKAQSVPFTQFKELILPVPQIGIQYQINPNLTIGGYYQFGWAEDRLPSAGSYFSVFDPAGEGGEFLISGPLTDPNTGQVVIDPVTHHPAWEGFVRSHDLWAKNSGQWGVEFKVRAPRGYSLGFYALNFHEKTPFQLYVAPIIPGIGSPSPLPPNYGGVIPNVQIGNYYFAYPENIKVYGMSATKTTGIVNWAAEISGRTNMDLVSDAQLITPGHGGNIVIGPSGPKFVITANNSNNPLYAVGDSLHANFSALATFGPTFIAKEATLIAEVAWNCLLSITKNPAALDPHATHNAVGFQWVYTPTYRQVRPGLDLSPNVGFSFYPMGRSSVIGSFGPDQGGSYSVGVNASYRERWQVGVTFNGFYGPAAGFIDSQLHYSFGQTLADRNFISFSMYRTFGVRAERKKRD